MASVWPSLPLAEFEPTKNTLILWAQVVGKVRIARTPLVNHWWNAPLYLTPRGLTTSLIPGGPGRSFAIDFDFLAGSLDLAVTDGSGRRMALAEQRTVEEFHARLMELLDELGLHTEIWPVPVELEGAIPFPDDDAPRAYDPEQALRFWRLLVEAERVLTAFRAGFVGKNSPVHLFWGALDLATTRFSGRTAPPHPGGAPNCGPHVMHEAYSHEVSSAGYWPGGEGEGFFYSYAYPEPSGYREMPAGVPEAHYDAALGEFVLPYEAVRTAADPDATLLAFLQATYEAAAVGADWPRAELER
ncbi:hypothetical protein EDD29_7363 [Actinocorallia herbida]|uniref:Ava_C0101 and related proteins n=1 Tax=Actinocorallia herbida TaxID=58109 RepID=A0A3N1D9A1_9ACTN|nr:DUF5996 family protein [Actinocorallia herbida]ROO89658.1 hypothetical protein EDD29_7363 [Actinocorallia herbida]